MTLRSFTVPPQFTNWYHGVRDRIRGRFIIVVATMALIAGAFIVGYIQRPSPIEGVTISSPAPRVTTIQVPFPVITERVVTKYIAVEDRAVATALLAENAALKIKVDQLSVSLAESQSRGQGIATTSVTPPTATTPAITTVTFKDWRLTFTSINDMVNYTLSQKFSIVNTVGYNNNRVPTNLIRLYEIDGQNARIEIPILGTTTVAASRAVPHFYTKLTVQGGVAYADGQRVVIATPWLKRGRSTATEDTAWAFVTPLITLSSDKQAVGLAPVSYNIGSLPRQPLTNLWVSPFVATTTGIAITQKGVLLSVTF